MLAAIRATCAVVRLQLCGDVSVIHCAVCLMSDLVCGGMQSYVEGVLAKLDKGVCTL
jgi:hypothetical protein